MRCIVKIHCFSQSENSVFLRQKSKNDACGLLLDSNSVLVLFIVTIVSNCSIGSVVQHLYCTLL